MLTLAAMGPVDGALAASGLWGTLRDASAHGREQGRAGRLQELREHELVASVLTVAAGAVASLLTGLLWPLAAGVLVSTVLVGVHELLAARGVAQAA